MVPKLVGFFDAASQNSTNLCGAGAILRMADNSLYKVWMHCGLGTNPLSLDPAAIMLTSRTGRHPHPWRLHGHYRLASGQETDPNTSFESMVDKSLRVDK